MATFEEFVATELPKRPFTSTDGPAGWLPVRSSNPLAARELVWVDPATIGGSGGGNQVIYEATGALSGHRLVAPSPTGGVRYADSLTTTDASLVLGLTLGAAADGDPIVVQHAGPVTEPTWSWTPEAPVFAGPAGTLTQTAPLTGFSLVVGIAVTPTTLFIGIKQPIIKT